MRTKIAQGAAKANVDAKSQLESIRTEKLLKLYLKQLSKNRKDITTEKKSARWKLAIASDLKSRTGLRIINYVKSSPWDIRPP